MTQNLVSANFSAEEKAEVMNHLKSISDSLNFLQSIAPQDVSSLFKAGTAYLPLIDIVHEVVNQHPEIMPRIFDIDELNKDYELFINLRPIEAQIKELTEAVEKTCIAAGSDLMDASFEVYAAVKQNKDKVPGLDATYKEMAKFFKRSRKKKDDTKE